MNDSSVAEMSESQFKDSLDALIAGELDDNGSRLTPLPSSESSECSSMAFTTEALHQHEAKPGHQQQPAINDFQAGNRQMARAAMSLMESGTMFPLPIVSGRFQGDSMAGVHSVPMSDPSSLYAESDSASSRQGSRKTRSSRASNKRKKEDDSTALISGDEGSRIKRKEERNAREQKRSQQIVDQIANLRDLLSSSNVPTKADKYSTLVTAAKYIRQLQGRAALLENEQKKLLVTIGQATDLVNNKYIPVTSTAEAAENVSLDLSVGPKSDVTDEDESSSFVPGLDYRFVFLACPVAGAITSIDGRFLDCNDDFEDMTGYTKDELFRKPSESSPFEPSERHMSVFNVLKREDMERLFVVMSDMLRKPAVENPDASTERERREADRWSDRVSLNRKDNVQVRREYGTRAVAVKFVH